MFPHGVVSVLGTSVVVAMLAGKPALPAPFTNSFDALDAAGSTLFERLQADPGGAIDPNRDCQTVRLCRFTQGGIFRGCISAFSCRTCQFAPARCTISGRERICRQLRCSWGA
jgi:hypothetical protein